MTTDQPPILLTSRTRKVPGHVGVVGPADVLQTAFETGQQVTIGGGKYAGERVHLGHTRQTYDDGITLETIGLDHPVDFPKLPDTPGAVYLVDLTRLNDAPLLARFVAEQEAGRARAAAVAECRAAAEEDRYLNQEY